MSAAKEKHFLLFLSDVNVQQLKHILKKLTKTQTLALRELVINFLHGNLHVDTQVVSKLKIFKKFLKAFAYGVAGKDYIVKKRKAIHILLQASRKDIEDL